jgi:hypothetical protein
LHTTARYIPFIIFGTENFDINTELIEDNGASGREVDSPA